MELEVLDRDDSKWTGVIARIDEHDRSLSPYLTAKMVGLLGSLCMNPEELASLENIGKALLDEQVVQRPPDRPSLLRATPAANLPYRDGHVSHFFLRCCTLASPQFSCAQGYEMPSRLGGGWNEHLRSIVEAGTVFSESGTREGWRADLILGGTNEEARRLIAAQFSESAARELLEHWLRWHVQLNWLIGSTVSATMPEFIPDIGESRYSLSTSPEALDSKTEGVFVDKESSPFKSVLPSAPRYSLALDEYNSSLAKDLSDLRLRVGKIRERIQEIRAHVQLNADKADIRASVGSVISLPIFTAIKISTLLTGALYLLYWTVSARARSYFDTHFSVAHSEDLFWFPRLSAPSDPLGGPWPVWSDWVGRLIWWMFHTFPICVLFIGAFGNYSPIGLLNRSSWPQGPLNYVCGALLVAVYLAMLRETSQSTSKDGFLPMKQSMASSRSRLYAGGAVLVVAVIFLVAPWTLARAQNESYTPWTLWQASIGAAILGLPIYLRLGMKVPVSRQAWVISFLVAGILMSVLTISNSS